MSDAPPQPEQPVTVEVTVEGNDSVDSADTVLPHGGRPEALDQDRELSLARVQAGLFRRRPPDSIRLARYLLRKRLGSGGLGVVYEAFDPDLDRLVAVKVLAPTRALSENRARLRREAASMARLVHPNVVAVYDIGQTDDTELVDLQSPEAERPRGTFVVMELVRGVDLNRWLKKPRRPERILEVFIAAGRGLAAAHACDLIHRDFKPANVMLGRDGSVKVLDFGLARLMRDAPGGSDASGSRPLPDQLGSTLTRTGTVMGTPIYMAPEQHDGQVDARSDQFSFCASLYEALAGVRPYRAETIEALLGVKLAMQLSAPKVPLPRRVAAIVRRGLDPDPSRRFEDMPALLRELDRAMRWRPRRVAAVVGLGVIAIGGAWTWSLRDRGDPCVAEAAARVEQVWTPERAAALDAAFTAADSAPDLDKLHAAVTRYLGGWSRTWLTTCAADTAGRERDLVRTCLQTRHEDLITTLEVVASAGAGTVPRAGDLLEAVPRADACLEDARLAAGVVPPPPGDTADAVAATRRMLARSAALAAADRHDESAQVAADALAAAEATDYAPVLVEARLRLASARGRQGEPDAAIDLASAAYFSARTTRNDAGAADAALLLSWLLYDADQYDAALAWVRHARAALPNDVGPSLRTAIASRREASIRLARDELDVAERLARDALRMLRDLEDAHEIEIATTLSVLGMLARQRGDEPATVALLSEAVALAEGVYGDQHSAVQSRLTSLGLALTEVGEYERARVALERSLRLATKLYGDDSRFTVAAKRALGHALRHLEKYDQARALFTEALEWDSHHRPPGDPLRGHDLRGLALLAAAEGEPERAAALLEDVLRLWEGNRVSSAFVAHAELELARALHATAADPDRVRALAEAAAARYDAYGVERADDAASARAFVAELGAPAAPAQ